MCAACTAETICRDCGQRPALAGLHWCRECQNRWHREYNRAKAKRRQTQVCASCREPLPVGHFKPDDSPDGRMATCISCLSGPRRRRGKTPAEWLADEPPGAYALEYGGPPPRTPDHPYWLMMDACEAAEARLRGQSQAANLAGAMSADQADAIQAKAELAELQQQIEDARRELARLNGALATVGRRAVTIRRLCQRLAAAVE